MKRTLGLLFTLNAICWADDLAGQIDAQWSIDRQWSNTNADQNWIEAQDWQPTLSAQISLIKNGFGLGGTIAEKASTLDELYYDFSTANAEWTLGRKPQEWAYGYNENALNWVDQEIILLREQFVPFGSWQNWCYVTDSIQGCATRLSGWFEAADWQIMLDYRDYWRAGLGIQTQLGDGGLTYVELYVSEHDLHSELRAITTDSFRLEQSNSQQTQVNIGAQWTTSFNLTIQTELLWFEHGLDKNDWQKILNQLPTEQAGLVADAFNHSLSKTQYMVRVAVPWKQVTLENISLYWPAADESVLNQFSAEVKITSTLSAKASWQHNFDQHVLRRIGQQNRVTVQFQFLDGF